MAEEKSRKAGENGMAEYVDYLNNYDRKARGEGSSRGKDRFSGLDVRYVYDAKDDFGIDKYDAASEVLKYARSIEGKSSMGGATEDALDKLRGILAKRPSDDGSEPVKPETGGVDDPQPPSDSPYGGDPVDDGGIANQIIDSGGNDQSIIGVIPGPKESEFGMSQNVNQDNDINTNIDGDGNTVTNNQDNSVGQYSGSTFLKGWMKDHDFFKD